MAVKLTLKEALALLATAGVPHVEIVETDDLSDYTTTSKSDAPVTPDTLLMAIDANRETIIAPKVIQAKTGEIHTSVTGKINGSLRSQLSQKTGIPLSELKDLNSQEAIAKAYDFYANTLGADKGELIKERDLLMQKHSENIKEKEREWQEKLNGVTAKLTEKEIIAKLVKDHNEAKGLPPNTNKAALAKQFKTYLDGNAIVKYNEEKDEIELYDKKNPDIRLYTNDTKTTYAKPADFLKPYYSDLGIWNEDNRNINPKDEMAKHNLNTYVPKPDDKGQFKSPLDEKLAALSAYKPSV